jgi:hypothetical protein
VSGACLTRRSLLRGADVKMVPLSPEQARMTRRSLLRGADVKMVPLSGDTRHCSKWLLLISLARRRCSDLLIPILKMTDVRLPSRAVHQPVTTARYAHLAADPVRAASNLIGAEIAALMNGKKHVRERLRIDPAAPSDRHPKRRVREPLR